MPPKPESLSPLTHHPVIVRPEPPGQFTAEPLGVPELRAVAATAAEALRQVQQALTTWPGALHWVPLAPVPAAAGHAKDDPDFDQYLDEIERYRREAEARECSSSSSTPTT
jgi:hypothetical protein